MKGVRPQQGVCSCCGYSYSHLPMDYLIAVGFGSASLTKNGIEVWSEQREKTEYLMTVQDAEKLAVESPDDDWRVHIIGPLSEVHFQRQELNKWVLYEQGEGFA